MPVRVLEGEADCAASLRRAVVPDHNPVAGLAELVRPDHDDRLSVRDQVDRRRPTSTVSVAPRPRLPTTVRSACRDSAARTGNGKPLVTAGLDRQPGLDLAGQLDGLADNLVGGGTQARRQLGQAERYPEQRPDERMYDPQDRAARRGRGGPADRGLCRDRSVHTDDHTRFVHSATPFAR